MPQTPLPNTGTILPSDHGDGDQWDLLLDNCFRNYDGHNHANGAGAQVSISSLKIDADISFVDPLGGKHAISDLKAIDFAPVAASALTPFSGAFFLNNADNELYFRTFTGVNVKVTNGATLNSAAFVGGITGDYSAVGAEEKYDDATNAYWFTQQVGAAVRQYAKMQCADLKLFEFKAHGATPVPLTSVTLKSPAALAANYALTMPAALPASASGIQVSATGVMSYENPTNAPINYSIALGVPAAGITFLAGGGFSGNVPTQWQMGTTTSPSTLPLTIPVGLTIASWSVRLQKNSTTGTIRARLWDANHVAASVAQIGVDQTNGASAPGLISLGQAGLATTAADGHSYFIELLGGGSATPSFDIVYGYSVTPA